jgi:uncharacterized sporulation protein YeaH/YhbH (DUF444 family)
VDIVKTMLEHVNMFCYGEVSWENDSWVRDSTLRKSLDEITSTRLMTSVLHHKHDVYPTLAKFLNKEMSEKE